MHQPVLKRLARFGLEQLPWLQRRIHTWLHRLDEIPPRRPHVPQDISDLSPATETLYLELRQHFGARQR
jgi:hypothetical protein